MRDRQRRPELCRGDALVRPNARRMLAATILRAVHHGPRLLAVGGRNTAALHAGHRWPGVLHPPMRLEHELSARRDVHAAVGRLRPDGVLAQRLLSGSGNMHGGRLPVALRQRRRLPDVERHAPALRRRRLLFRASVCQRRRVPGDSVRLSALQPRRMRARMRGRHRLQSRHGRPGLRSVLGLRAARGDVCWRSRLLFALPFRRRLQQRLLSQRVLFDRTLLQPGDGDGRGVHQQRTLRWQLPDAPIDGELQRDWLHDPRRQATGAAQSMLRRRVVWQSPGTSAICCWLLDGESMKAIAHLDAHAAPSSFASACGSF